MSVPETRAIPGGQSFIWLPEKIRFRMTRFTRERRSQAESCEVLVESIATEVFGHLHQSRVNLTSTISKQQLAKALHPLDDRLAWAEMVEQACTMALALSRRGEPMTAIGNLPLPESPRFRVRPLIVDNEANLIYGDGGTFKSYLALYIATLVQSGEPDNGFMVQQGNVLYLDWETSEQTANARLRALATGLHRQPVIIQYRRCYAPLSDDVEAVQQMVYEAKIKLVVVDSVAAAAGEELKEAESASHMYNALRTLGVTSLLITHVPKLLPGQTSSTPYGSVYFRNYTRNAWELRKIQEAGAGGITLGLYNRKNNDGKLHSDIGLDISFTTGANDVTTSVTISRGNVKVDRKAEKEKSDADKIRERLLVGGLTDDALSTELAIPLATVQARLSDLRKAGLIVYNPDGTIELNPGM